MTTSNSVNFSTNRDTMVLDALRLLDVVGIEDDACTAAQSAHAIRFLNYLVKAMMADGMTLWATTQSATLFLQNDQVKYLLGATDHASNTVVETTLSTTKASSATTLTLTSSSGMTVGDNLGVELDSGTIYWTTISTIPDSTSVTIPANSQGAAASGNVVYTYTTRVNIPYRVWNVQRHDENGLDVELEELSREEYLALPNKTSEGVPNSYFYDAQLNNGVLYVWPEPSDVSIRLRFTYSRILEDFDAATDTPDFPQDWYLAIIYQLAVLLAPSYGRLAELDKLQPLASLYYNVARSNTNQSKDIHIQVDFGDN